MFYSGAVALLTVLALSTSPAQAGLVLFDFEQPGIQTDATDGQISAYMSNRYGSRVVADRVGSDNNATLRILGNTINIDPQPWDGNSGQYLVTDSQILIPFIAPMTISFLDHAIATASFDGYIFRNSEGDDFTFKAFDANGDLVTSRAYQSVGGFSSGTIVFSRPVTQLYFSDNFIHDVGIDNLAVTSAPEPTTLTMAGIAALAGAGYYARRRRAGVAA